MLSNRQFTPASEDYVHVVTIGEHPHPSGVVQVIDAPTVRTMVAEFEGEKMRNPNFPGLPVDCDHKSRDQNGTTEAMGWITSLEARPSGLWANVAFTEIGDRFTRDGTYRNVSPSFDASRLMKLGGNRVSPLRLESLALCNDPNIKGMVPLSNRRADGPRPPEAAALALHALVNRHRQATGGTFQQSWDATRAARAAILQAVPSGSPSHRPARAVPPPSLAEVASGAWATLSRQLANRYQIDFTQAWNRVRHDCPELVALARDRRPAGLTNRGQVALAAEDLGAAMKAAAGIEDRVREELRASFGAAGPEYARTAEGLRAAAWQYFRTSLKALDFDAAWERMRSEQPLLWQAFVLHHDDWVREGKAKVALARGRSA